METQYSTLGIASGAALCGAFCLSPHYLANGAAADKSLVTTAERIAVVEKYGCTVFCRGVFASLLVYCFIFTFTAY